jgi:membrane-bound ClpP family serine protease
MAKKQPVKFEEAAKEQRPSLAAEFLYFLKHSKKWWLLPILIVLAVVGLLAAFSASGVAPFIYAGGF